jgi:PncC family amidohydrolase
MLSARRLTLAVAEGDTGGLLLSELTSVPGSSAVVVGGVVAYDDRLKIDVLGVPRDVIAAHGAVSAEVAEAMARAVRRVASADIGVSTTGSAGPGGARPGKPVGLAYVAVAFGQGSETRRFEWQGDRAANRASSVAAAFELVREVLENKDTLEQVCYAPRSEAQRGTYG